MTHLQKLIVALLLALLPGLPLMPAAPMRPKAIPPPKGTSILGVHSRLTDEQEWGKVNKSLDMIQQMGASWLVEYFPWAYIEASKGGYFWGHSDDVIDTAVAKGLKVVARLDMVPEWARPVGSTSRYLAQDHFTDYAEFTAAFASHYRGKVDAIVIWNEPNLSFEWGYRPVDPVAYTQLLRTSYLAIKAANPDVSVVAAGLAPTLDKGQWGLDDLDYLQQMYDAGAAPYFDKLAIHSYGWRSPPDDPASPDKVNFARSELLRDVMVKNGDAAKSALITESGWNDAPRWTKAVRPAQRIQYSLRAVDKVAQEWPWADAIAFWNFRLPKSAHNYSDYFTFVTVDFTSKAIYKAFVQRADAIRQAGPGAGAGGG